MKNHILILMMLSIISCTGEKGHRPDYPVTRKGNTIDTIFGTPVPDPYRWLEDDRSAETAEWVKAQNVLTFGYLEKIPYRDQIKKKLTEMWNFEKFQAPFIEGEYTYFFKNDGLQNQFVLYRQKEGREPEIFIDPNKFSADGTISLGEIGFSHDGSLMGYSISEGGSDWRKIIVMNTSTRAIVGDTLKDVKFSGIEWQGNEGFYYSSYDRPKGSQLSEMTDHHKLYFHKLGTKQSGDKVIFGADVKRRYVGAGISEDQRFLIVTAANSTTGNELYIKDLSKPGGKFVTVVDNFNSDSYILDNEGDQLLISTNLNAPNKKIVTVSAADPSSKNWKDLIAETTNVLEASTGSGYIFAHYMVDAISKVLQYDLKGKLIREIRLPDIGSASGFGGKKTYKNIYFTFTNYITPASIYKLDPKTGESTVYKKPAISFDGSKYTSEQVFYNSKDGTRIPMIITYRKGLEKNGKNPCILYGYGGFNISETPGFSVSVAVWLELGGIYAVPNIRGGGEYGEKWHLAGTRMNKQNVFDDFIAAGEYLVNNRYTSHDYLAIRGGSNGGLLVGAVMTQRPDLMKVALPAVGVMDMLRYNKFTAGAGWAYDYGTAEDSREMFGYLLHYSPVHNVKEGVEYPATLVTTGDHDDRVVPAHSFKFAANLQAGQKGANPVLIRIETRAGHGAGTPVSKTIEQYTDLYGFTLWNMGIKELK
ncbi:MAG TPA: prolyl oligopeptidase family serine peptidase [Bacteroidales bacterium]|nr:prolyl oligopeptidase family serine peptidase [Bacteroidales bacterium]